MRARKNSATDLVGESNKIKGMRLLGFANPSLQIYTPKTTSGSLVSTSLFSRGSQFSALVASRRKDLAKQTPSGVAESGGEEQVILRSVLLISRAEHERPLGWNPIRFCL